MVKKTVKLVPQERFDLIDARALQQGTLEYVGSALGNLMGYSNGLLTELTTQINTADKTIIFSECFAFFVTKAKGSIAFNADGTGYSGEVILYDPSSPAQAAQSIDYTTIANAKDEYFANGSKDAEGNDASPNSRLLTIGLHAPFLWARPVQVEGQLDARRKWSVAQQSEVPVTMNTRVFTVVEFALSASMPAVAEGSGQWAPIAKIVQWTGAGSNTPILIPISAFDSQKWHDRSNVESIGDVDSSVQGVQGDYFSQESPNLATWNIFERYSSSNAPAVSLLYDMLLNESQWENVQAPREDRTISTRLAQLDNYLEDGGTFDDANIKIKRNAQSAAWDKFNGNASNGIVDQLASLKTVIQNTVGSGLLDHGSSIHDVSDILKPFEGGSIHNLKNVFEALGDKFESHWSARPLRSLNSLALENLCQSDEINRLNELVLTNLRMILELTIRVNSLEADQDQFASVPINGPEPLVPALSLTFHTNYGLGARGFDCFAGPENALESVSFFVRANMYSQISYARGGVRIQLSPECIESLGGFPALSRGQVTIHATPIHNSSSNPWLLPTGLYGIGKLDGTGSGQVVHEGGTDHYTYQGESLRKSSKFQVLNAFANFYQCTLNVILFSDEGLIEVYPVNTVPDIIENGHDLRGYPAFGGWVGRISDDEEDRDTWSDGTIQSNTGRMDESYADGTAFGWLHGDVTNPDIYRERAGATDVSDGNYVTSLSKAEIFGHQDDLRGFAQSLTFLRPDRFSFGGANRNERIAAPEFDARHNAPDTHTIDDGSSDVKGQNFDTLNNIYGHNGRFMPSFSLTIYKNSFTSLGSDINDANNRINIADFDIRYNDAGVPDANGDVITSGDVTTKGGG